MSAAAGSEALGLIRGQVPSVRMAAGVPFVSPDASIPRETAISVGGHSAQFPLLGLE